MSEEEDRSYIEEQMLSRIDPTVVDKWGDPNLHPETQLTEAEVQQLLDLGREIFITHLTKTGFPMVTVHVYCLIDGVMWSTTTKGRVKATALKNDARCGVCISAAGLGVDFGGAMTLKTRAEIVEDRDIVERVCREHGKRYYTSPKGQELFFQSLFTPNRVAMRFDIEKVVSWKNIGIKDA